MMKVGLLSVLALGVASFGWADTVALWDGTGATDSTTWGQLGADGTTISNGATATSAGGNTVTLDFVGGSNTGLNSVQCPASPCSWTGGFAAGEALVWAFDGTNGTAPTNLFFTNSIGGAGLAVQSDAAGSFMASSSQVY